MHHKIAVVGAGITGIMTALACAQRGASVDLYDAGQIPNKNNLSWDYGRLWRYIHENNPVLQSLAASSQLFWQKLILNTHNDFGCQTQSVRVLNDVESQRLINLYQNASIPFEIHNRYLSTQSSLLRIPLKYDDFFIGHDAILLNASNIYTYLYKKLAEYENVNIYRDTMVNLNEIEDLKSLLIEGRKIDYTSIICTVSRSISAASNLLLQQRYQVHFNIHINDDRAALLKPVLNMGDENKSWCVPSLDKKILKVSASNFSYSTRPDDFQVKECKEYLLSIIAAKYGDVETHVSPYFELSNSNRQSFPYWSYLSPSGAIVVEACDASIFKIAPALSTQICNHIFKEE